MNTMVILALVSVVLASALFIALAAFLILIVRQLNPAGGTDTSLLAKIRLGLRAIETETAYLPREVTKLNAGLTGVRGGLAVVDANLAQLESAVVRQEAR